MDNFLMTFAYAFVTTFVFVGQGFTLGTICDNEDNAKQVNQMFIMLMFATSGIMASADSGSNSIVRFLISVSPSRLSCNGVLRRMSTGVPTKTIGTYTGKDAQGNPEIMHLETSPQSVLEFYDLFYTDIVCLSGLGCWLLFWVIIGIFVTNRKYKKL